MIYIQNPDRGYPSGERESAQTELEYLHSGKLFCKVGDTLQKVGFEPPLLVYIEKGSMTREDGGRLRTGEFLLLPLGAHEKLTARASTHLIYISFFCHPSVFHADAVFSGSGAAVALVEQILRQSQRNIRFPAERDGALLALLGELAASGAGGSASSGLFADAGGWVDAHIRENILPSDVAAALGVTVAYLNRIVSRQTGRRLGEWIAERRISCMESHCIALHLSAKQMAETFGFASAELFCKYYKYHTGKSFATLRKGAPSPARPTPCHPTR